MITRTVTIANGASLSSALTDVDGASLVGIVMPAAWTTANLTLQFSHDDTAYNNVYADDGVEVTIIAGASQYIRLNPADFLGANAVKVRSGTSGTPVNQGGDRVITLVLFNPE